MAVQPCHLPVGWPCVAQDLPRAGCQAGALGEGLAAYQRWALGVLVGVVIRSCLLQVEASGLQVARRAVVVVCWSEVEVTLAQTAQGRREVAACDAGLMATVIDRARIDASGSCFVGWAGCPWCPTQHPVGVMVPHPGLALIALV